MKLRFFMLYAAIAAAAAVHAEQSADTKETPNVLLALEKTRFKSALIDEMKGLLKKKGAKVSIADHSDGGNLPKFTAADYDAVFITNSGVNSKVRPWVTQWLEANKKAASRIILHTTQIRKWEVEVSVEVDAITSASSMGNTKELAAEYVEKIAALLSSPKKDSKEDDG